MARSRRCAPQTQRTVARSFGKVRQASVLQKELDGLDEGEERAREPARPRRDFATDDAGRAVELPDVSAGTEERLVWRDGAPCLERHDVWASASWEGDARTFRRP